MIDPAPLRLAVLISSAFFVCGCAIAYLRLSLTKYHIPLLVLILVVVSGGLIAITTGVLIWWDSGNIDYTVSSSDEFSEIVEYHEIELPPDPEYTELPIELQREYTNYSELSPEAQELFRTVLEADGTYTRRSHPSDISVIYEYTDPANRIYYNSEAYILVGESRRGFGTPVMATIYLILGVLLLALGAGGAGVYPEFKFSLSAIVGIVSVGVCVISGITQWGVVSLVLGLATWGALGGLECYYQISFRERMKT